MILLDGDRFLFCYKKCVKMLMIFSGMCTLVPCGILVGCSVLASWWALLYSNFVFSRTSTLMDATFVQECAFITCSGQTLPTEPSCEHVRYHCHKHKVPTGQCPLVVVPASQKSSIAEATGAIS